MPIKSRKDKRSFNQGKTQQMSKVNKKKYWAANMTFGIHDKAPDVIRWLRLVIHQRKNWICIMMYVKRIMIFEVNKGICHFLYKDNKRKRNDE
jgi:hypothetical protein